MIKNLLKTKKTYNLINPVKIMGLFCLVSNSISSQCTTATLVTASPSVACVGSQVNLSASSFSGSTIFWYNALTGGTALGSSLSGGNFSVTAATTTTYYAQSSLASTAGGSLAVSFTGSVQTVVIPSGVTQVTLMASGAQGGSNAQGVTGGLGGYASGVLSVNPGDVLNIYVGGSNGYNGGGIASNTACPTAQGGNGGGASDIRLNGTSLADRILVAGGGGGAAGNRVSGCGRGSGGAGGGGFYGGGGGASWPQTSTVVPTGGTQNAGGIGGTSTYTVSAPNANGQAGSLGQGGNGGIELNSNQAGSQIGAIGGAGGGTVGVDGSYAGNFSGQSGAGGSSYIGGVTSGTTATGIRTGNGQVIILGVSSLGCVSAPRTPITLSVSPNSTVAVTASSSTICAGNSVTLTASGVSSYSWNTGATTSSIVVSPTTSTTYSVVYASGCSNTATTSVGVNPNPTITATSSSSLICAGQSATITPSGASTYTISGGNLVVSPTVTTTYTISGTSASGCISSSNFTQNVSACTGIEESAANHLTGVSIYPNPATGVINIDLNEKSNVIITNTIGSVIMTKEMQDGKNSIDLSNLSNGVYFIKVTKEGKQETFKFIKN